MQTQYELVSLEVHEGDATTSLRLKIPQCPG
ncbi:MAG: hypothetical protein CM15mP103_06940 [Gammaproteobacteria bacterium]|nr:MAG: hypothetical protein CM15mP103_06940 [Gammaproteobacteria bacterium]